MIASWLVPVFVSIVSLLSGYGDTELLFVGDAMQHQGQLNAARKSDSSYDYSSYFSAIKPLVSAADYAVVNLETPVGAGTHTGYPCFYAPTEFVDALKDAGFDLFLTANNHTLDRGTHGLKSTISELNKRSLDHIGTYCDSTSRSMALPMIKGINGFRLGFLNYTYGTNGLSPRDGVVVDYINRAQIKADVEAAKAAGAEMLCVCIHWGDEYKLLPNKAQQNLADFLEALGVDMIIGSHPHVIQPMEFRDNRYHNKKVLIVYSLGNFVSDMKTADTRGGALVRVKLSHDYLGKVHLVEANYHLLFTIAGSSPENNFRVMEADSVESAIWKTRARDFSKRARDIFDRHNIGVSESKIVVK
ncbi:MAG: CapA family protein [Muribaculaceae bacterium]|nr:CapA family protein [Muribaculaceae bacterium]